MIKQKPYWRFKGLGFWNLYFLIKLWLHLNHYIQMNFVANLALACVLMIAFSSSYLNTAKHTLAAFFALGLIYSESWLPPITTLTSNFKLLSDFSIGYLFDLSGRFINTNMILTMLIATTAYLYFSKWIRFTTISLLGLVIIPVYSQLSLIQDNQGLSSTPYNKPVNQMAAQESVQQINSPMQADSPEQALNQFYSQQKALPAVIPNQLPQQAFDILILNICSLSNADLTAAGVDAKNLFSHFDVVFNQYNAGTTYSGPAALRILRSSCGHVPHSELFSQTNEVQCYLFENLKKLGYQTNLTMNHDGHFDNFIGLLQNQGNLNTELTPLKDSDIAQYAFDDTPVYRDFSLLNQWLDTHKTKTQPQAMYYNSISLHDGNQVINQSKLNDIQSYALRLKMLFTDIEQFIRQIELNGRPTMLIVIPEHGAALKGDKMQFSGLREIPSPNIVNVPVAIKFIGKQTKLNSPLYVQGTYSHYALSTLIERALNSDAFSTSVSINELIEQLPKTELVAENENAILMEYQNKPYIKLNNRDWMQYPGI